MIRKWFSERNGYKTTDVLVKNTITDGFRNGVINMYLELRSNCGTYGNDLYSDLDKFIHTECFKKSMLYYNYNFSIISYLNQSDTIVWYNIFDMLEYSYSFLYETSKKYGDVWYRFFQNELNRLFERENYVYRLNKSGNIIEVTSDEEMAAVDEALENPIDGVRVHLQTALNHLSASQKEPDYRNSIKESISAVECYCRAVTGANSLGAALSNIEDNGVTINATLKKAMEKLYGYTNNSDTGIRHALLDDANPPTSAEAIYMLVTCSAFINYLTNKDLTVRP